MLAILPAVTWDLPERYRVSLLPGTAGVSCRWPVQGRAGGGPVRNTLRPTTGKTGGRDPQPAKVRQPLIPTWHPSDLPRSLERLLKQNHGRGWGRKSTRLPLGEGNTQTNQPPWPWAALSPWAPMAHDHTLVGATRPALHAAHTTRPRAGSGGADPTASLAPGRTCPAPVPGRRSHTRDRHETEWR